jgi:hypothetical protein
MTFLIIAASAMVGMAEPEESELPTLSATMTPGVARPAAEAPRKDEPGLSVGGNYVHVSPGLVGFTPIADAATVAYVWGLAGGRYFTAGKRFAGAAGGFGEHMMLWFLSGEGPGGVGPPTHEVRLGAELRLGMRGRRGRVFAYGIGRLGAALTLDYYTYDNDPVTYEPINRRTVSVYPWVMGSAGAGVQGLIGRRLLIGGEQFFDIGGDAFFLARFRLIVGVRF